jgi:hypothetical protein
MVDTGIIDDKIIGTRFDVDDTLIWFAEALARSLAKRVRRWTRWQRTNAWGLWVSITKIGRTWTLFFCGGVIESGDRDTVLAALPEHHFADAVNACIT